MVSPDEDNLGPLDTDFEASVESFIRDNTPNKPQPSNPVAHITEADSSFYQRVIDACKSSIDSLDEQLRAIDEQATQLLESKKKLFNDRQRLATQRNAARIAMRAIEDSEARQQASRG